MNSNYQLLEANTTALYAQVLSIRQMVFVEEQGVDAALEVDHAQATYYLLTKDNIAVATGRYRIVNDQIKIERMAVLPPFRNQGVGSVLLIKMLEIVLPLDKTIVLNAQIKAKSFYIKNGFITQSEHFFEANIEHVSMRYLR